MHAAGCEWQARRSPDALPPPATCPAVALQEGEAAQQALFPYFAEWVLERYRQDIRAYR